MRFGAGPAISVGMSIETVPTPVTVTLPVQWGDQDALGHVNNAVYLRWLESGRIALLGRLDIEANRQANAIVPVLATVTVHFRRPVTFPAMVEVESRLAKVGRTSLTLEQHVRVQGEEGDVADATSVVVIVDAATGRPHPLPEALRADVTLAARRSP